MDANEILNSALAVHESVGWWVSWLLAVLEANGINREEASLQMYALFSKMQEITREYAPAITSLTVTYTINNDVAHTLADEKLKDISGEVLALRDAVERLARGLTDVLKEEGWGSQQVSDQVSSAAEKLATLDSAALIRSLTFAVALDTYAKHLIKEWAFPTSP